MAIKFDKMAAYIVGFDVNGLEFVPNFLKKDSFNQL